MGYVWRSIRDTVSPILFCTAVTKQKPAGPFEIPMLLIAGDQSHYQKRRSSEFSDEYVHRVFRGSQIVTLAGAAAHDHHEDPQGVAAAIIDFARAHP